VNKIETLFDRDENFKVIPQVRAGCEWVIDGEGGATEKLDGTNVLIAPHPVSGEPWPFKRSNPTKAEKAAGVQPTNVLCVSSDPDDRWIWAAFCRTPNLRPGYHEAMGPKIQGNPLGLSAHVLVRIDEMPVYPDVPRTYEGLRDYMADLDSLFSPGHKAEGIVFHHPDGRMVKIKCKDFSKGPGA